MLIFILILTITFPNSNMKQSDENILQVDISLSKDMFKRNQSIMIKTTVTNIGNKSARFCNYHTPFEGIANEIFLIKRNDEEISYQGILKKRIPPTKDDYIILQAGKQITCTVTLNDNYDFSESGAYTVQYKGSMISGLPDSNEIRFVVE